MMTDEEFNEMMQRVREDLSEISVEDSFHQLVREIRDCESVEVAELMYYVYLVSFSMGLLEAERCQNKNSESVVTKNSLSNTNDSKAN